MDQERKFKGIWIPKEIWETNELTIQEKIILVEIDSLEDEQRGCFASNKHFSNFFQLTNQRVSQIIQSLKNKNYISIEYIKEGKEIKERRMRINKPPYPYVSNKFDRYQENYDKGIKFSKGGYQENFKENNTYINNTYEYKENNNKKFKKPTLEEINQYCLEANIKIDSQHFIDYYESNGWKVGKNPMKDWKATVRNWNRNKKEKEPKKIVNNSDLGGTMTYEELEARGWL